MYKKIFVRRKKKVRNNVTIRIKCSFMSMFLVVYVLPKEIYGFVWIHMHIQYLPRLKREGGDDVILGT